MCASARYTRGRPACPYDLIIATNCSTFCASPLFSKGDLCEHLRANANNNRTCRCRAASFGGRAACHHAFNVAYAQRCGARSHTKAMNCALERMLPGVRTNILWQVHTRSCVRLMRALQHKSRTTNTRRSTYSRKRDEGKARERERLWAGGRAFHILVAYLGRRHNDDTRRRERTLARCGSVVAAAGSWHHTIIMSRV